MDRRDFEITPKELDQALKEQQDIQLIDVREPEEIAYCSIGGIPIPLGELTSRYGELDSERESVVLCHHGVRSARATMFLRSQGFARVKNLAGGIDRWSIDVDPSVPRY